MGYYIEAFNKYAVFKGRARRKEYWMFTLWNWAIIAVLFVLRLISNDLAILGSLYGLGVFIPNLAVTVRRLHDTEHSAWWLLIGLIPILGLIMFIVLMVTDSHPGQSKYGPNPKEMETGGAAA